MARAAGKTYESDKRRWFRLDSEEFATRTSDLTDAEFRAFILILAWANENRTRDRDGMVHIARSQLLSVSPNGRESVAKSARVVRELCAKQSWTVREGDVKWSIYIEKLEQNQGFTPANKTKTKTKTKTTIPKGDSGGNKSIKPSEDPRVMEAWPLIRAAFDEHGKTLGESVGTRAPLILKRIEQDDATTEDLVAAVHGYVAFHGGLTKRDGDSFDPGQYFRPTTVFKAEGFSDKVDAGKSPRAVGGLSKWDRILSR